MSNSRYRSVLPSLESGNNDTATVMLRRRPRRLASRLLPYGILLLVLALAGVVYFVTRPAATVAAIHTAVSTKDFLALNDLVDFPAVRHSLKGSLTREMESRLGASGSGGTLGGMLGNMLLGPMVDLMVSPIGLAFILEGYSVKEAMQQARFGSNGTTVSPLRGITYETRWDSLSAYSIVVHKNGAPWSVLTLRRYGLFDWKLADINLTPSP